MTWLIVSIGLVILLFGFMVFFGAPYVPSQPRFLKRALAELYPLSENDHLIDVGSGDGIVLRIASQSGARATGYEINPILWLISRWWSRRDEKVAVKLANFWHVQLPDDATIVYAFSVKRDGQRFIKKLQAEADRLGRVLTFMCLATPLPALEPQKRLDAYYLYHFHPSQDKKLTI